MIRSIAKLSPVAAALLVVTACTTVKGGSGELYFEDVSPGVYRGFTGLGGLRDPVAVGAYLDVIVREQSDGEAIVASASSANESGVAVVSDGLRTTLYCAGRGATVVTFTDEGGAEDTLTITCAEADDLVLAARVPGDLLFGYANDFYPEGAATWPDARLGVAARAMSLGQPLEGYGLPVLVVGEGDAELAPFEEQEDGYWVSPRAPGEVQVEAQFGDPLRFVGLEGTEPLSLELWRLTSSTLERASVINSGSGASYLVLTDGAGHLVVPPADAELTVSAVSGPASLAEGFEFSAETGLLLVGPPEASGEVAFEVMGARLVVPVEG